MTTTLDLNRLLWQERAAGDDTRAWESLTAEPEGLVEEPGDLGLWLRPANAAPGTNLLAIHGGGFVSGSIATHRKMYGHLALAAGLNTLVVDYGLVPEHVYPSQLNHVRRIFDQVEGRVEGRLEGQVEGRTAVVGDSCGATLALDIKGAAALVLFSPWVDPDATGASYDTRTDPFFTRELVKGLAAAYQGDTPALENLPPTYVQVGADEALRDDAYLIPGARVDEFAGQLHTFQMAAGHSPIADDAIAKAGTWLRRTLGC
ncbi:alpha/beta hydrolase [Paractinoplanes lichenicola]|uniref:Alpha/beta hydrolase n=1 Tax=Paractinoplanes lichenicola TaxID=2802976 RepID=A0ABS1W6B8_9ACTN|nr:alpha/beta hydrolase [Actinoplanes lichenicola]MBL7262279.1 alpha/beta hydrolase [Actinoplanes lichenicola]